VSGEDAPRPCPENLIVLEIKTNKQTDADSYQGWREGALMVSERSVTSALGSDLAVERFVAMCSRPCMFHLSDMSPAQGLSSATTLELNPTHPSLNPI
jgi:hypothetical protein